MFRATLAICGRTVVKRFISSVSGENALPSNLRLPSNLIGVGRQKRASPSGSDLPVLRRCEDVIPAHLAPAQTWLESLGSCDGEPLGVVDLHPDVFSVPVRLDILHDVEVWQRNFKRIVFQDVDEFFFIGTDLEKVSITSLAHQWILSEWVPSEAMQKSNQELKSAVEAGNRGNRKEAAEHGMEAFVLHYGEEVKSRGVAHGPRGPTSYYYMLPMKVRVQGLKIALTAKLAQDYLHIVDSLEIPTPDPHYLLELVKHRQWGDSVLIVDVGDEFPQNILKATEDLKTVNIIPAIGLNVHSMLKHESLVLTLEAVKFLEKKLLWHDVRYTPLYPFKLPYRDMP